VLRAAVCETCSLCQAHGMHQRKSSHSFSTRAGRGARSTEARPKWCCSSCVDKPGLRLASTLYLLHSFLSVHQYMERRLASNERPYSLNSAESSVHSAIMLALLVRQPLYVVCSASGWLKRSSGCGFRMGAFRQEPSDKPSRHQALV